MRAFIPWNKINRGYVGFEELAVEFVNDRFPMLDWQPTKRTRDGNKDAVAIIVGYHNPICNEAQWWMEAKYSTTCETITRYRLDATIVSSILHGNVNRVIFVTNIQISAKTKMDIRKALLSSMNCRDVEYYTRFSLEEWLIQHPNICKKYFTDLSLAKDIFTKSSGLVITQDLEFFDLSTSRYAFKEPLRELRRGDQYIGTFEAFSPSEIVLTLKPVKEVTGIKIISNSEMHLLPGENQISFRFSIGADYHNVNNATYPPPSFILGNVIVVSKRYLEPKIQKRSLLQLASQNKLLCELEKNLSDFLKNKQFQMFCIEGVSGVGKTEAIRQIINNEIMAQQELYHVAFCTSRNYNINLIIDLAIFLLFPFVCAEGVDNVFLEKIERTAKIKGSFIFELIKHRNDIESIGNLIEQLYSYECFLPYEIIINQRIIILDDLQNLDNAIASLLNSLIIDIHERKLPVLIVLSAQPLFYQSNVFSHLKSACAYQHFLYELTYSDLISAAKMNKEEFFSMYPDIPYALEFNILELLAFLKFIFEDNRSLGNYSEFLLLCKAFKQSAINQEYIFQQFRRAFYEYPECKDVCDAVYWLCEPVHFPDEDYKLEISHLLTAGLVRYNSDAALIPYHDIYKTCYRAHFEPSKIIWDLAEQETPEQYRLQLENEIAPIELSRCIERIIELSDHNKKHSVMYILQDLFETNKHIELRNKVGTIDYYQLKLAYCLAASQLSRDQDSYSIFRELYCETEYSDHPTLMSIALSALWEIAILLYERLEYNQVHTYFKKMVLLMIRLKNAQRNKNNIMSMLRYHDIMMLDTMMKANLGANNAYRAYQRRVYQMERYGFEYRCLSFQVRFALTLCVQNMEECLSILKHANCLLLEKYGQNDKYSIWSAFHYNFFSMIWYSKPEQIEEVKKYHEALRKNQFSNYRQRIHCMASYHFSQNELSEGNQYLLLESGISKEMHCRQRAFHLSTVALYELQKGNMDSAVRMLEQSANLLQALPSYQRLIWHNFYLVSNHNFNSQKICFWFGGTFQNDYFYIDPRCSW